MKFYSNIYVTAAMLVIDVLLVNPVQGTFGKFGLALGNNGNYGGYGGYGSYGSGYNGGYNYGTGAGYDGNVKVVKVIVEPSVSTGYAGYYPSTGVVTPPISYGSGYNAVTYGSGYRPTYTYGSGTGYGYGSGTGFGYGSGTSYGYGSGSYGLGYGLNSNNNWC
uniref:Uncharacterized protein n=1 Tax=Glossina palpalis gambiensis TaxID=67801 RepID=A0A1B0AXN3_9MUSC